MKKTNPSSTMTNPEIIHRLQAGVEPLLAWYAQVGRELPWRVGKDPYRIWVSEIMLQQTRIETVKPYFARFLAALPDVQALSNASEDELLKLWQGLGYYSRVRNMQKAARVIMEQGGVFPHTASELRKLPGIGDYTAGAIASIAFGEKAPAVDGNVLRVVARYLDDHDDVMKPAVRRRVSEALSQVYPDGREGDFTQALMELGEVICLPGSALRCEVCPLKALCEGKRQGTAAELPCRTAKKPPKNQERTVLILRCGDKVALRRRPDKGLLAGLWELPGWDGFLPETEVQKQVTAMGLHVTARQSAGEGVHVFSHVRWQMKGILCEVEKEGGDFLWTDQKGLQEQWALPSAFRCFFPFLPGGKD